MRRKDSAFSGNGVRRRNLWLVFAVLILFCAAGAGTAAADFVEAGTFQDLYDRINDTQTGEARIIAITADIEVSAPLPSIGAGKDITLMPASGNDHRIRRTVQNTSSITGLFTIAGGNLTIANNSSTYTLTVDGGNIAGNNQSLIYVNGSTFTLADGKITNNTGASVGGVYVTSGGKFMMIGGTISNNTATVANGGGGVFVTGSGSTFTLDGGTITNNICTIERGVGGVHIAGGGNFTMLSGMIISNRGASGGGVYVTGSSSRFTMSGGTISGNSLTTTTGGGGGVYVTSSGTFTLEGSAAITGNNGRNAGGVEVIDNGIFIMSGGQISGNSNRGVYVTTSGSRFTMSGGTITNNIANSTPQGAHFNGGGGVYINSGTFNMSGTASVGTTNEVYLESGTFINVVSPLTGGAQNITHADKTDGTEIIRLYTGATDSEYKTLFNVSSGMSPYFLNYTEIPDSPPFYKLVRTYYVSAENDGNGTVTAIPASGIEGTRINLSVTPHDHYVLREWVSENVTVEEDNTFLMPTENVTVKAFFEPVYDVTVQYDSNGTAGADPASGIFGENITLNFTANIGYDFVEWQFTNNSSSITFVNADTFTMPAANITVTAVFAKHSYNISVSADNGTANATPVTGFMDDEITLDATPHPGYDFVEWRFTNTSIIVTDNKFIMPAEDVDITAVFEKHEYNISVSTAGHGTANATPLTGFMDDEITLNPTADTGYYFVEWQFTNNSSSIVVIDNKFIMPAEDVNVTAVFDAITYTVTVLTDGHGTANATPLFGTYEEPITLEATPYPGYTFKEWQFTNNSSSITFVEDSVFSMPADNITVTAIFTANPTPVPTPAFTSGGSDGNMNNAFRVLFETNGGSTVPPITFLSYGDRITAPSNPTKDGYTFGGWYRDEACTIAWSFADAIPGDLTLYAKWNKVAAAPTRTTTAPAATTSPGTSNMTGTPTPTLPATTTTTPVESPTAARTPAPVFGILAGLFAAGVLMSRRG